MALLAGDVPDTRKASRERRPPWVPSVCGGARQLLRHASMPPAARPDLHSRPRRDPRPSHTRSACKTCPRPPLAGEYRGVRALAPPAPHLHPPAPPVPPVVCAQAGGGRARQAGAATRSRGSRALLHPGPSASTRRARETPLDRGAGNPDAARGQPMTGRGPRSPPAVARVGHDRAMHQRPPPDRLPLQSTRQSRAYWLLWPSGSLRF